MNYILLKKLNNGVKSDKFYIKDRKFRSLYLIAEVGLNEKRL